MDLRKSLFLVIALGTIAFAAVMPAGAHGDGSYCAIAASPAQVNNVEMGPPVPNTNPMNPAAVGHRDQRRGEGNRFGIYYPATDPNQEHATQQGPFSNPHEGTGLIPATQGDNFNWRQTGNCANGGVFSGGGTGIGFCGRSIGYGTGTVGGHSGIIRWESAGTQLIVVDTTPNNTTIGSVNAQANPPGSPNGSCLDGGAAVFVVDGVLVHR